MIPILSSKSEGVILEPLNCLSKCARTSYKSLVHGDHEVLVDSSNYNILSQLAVLSVIGELADRKFDIRTFMP